LQHRLEQFAHFGWIAGGTDTASFHDFELGVSSIFATRNQCASMPHPFSGRSSHAGNKPYDGLSHIVFSPTSSVHFVRAANFTDHHNGIGVRIFVEHLEHVDVLQAVDGVATNTHGGRLAKAKFSQLSNCFVRERTGTADHAD